MPKGKDNNKKRVELWLWKTHLAAVKRYSKQKGESRKSILERMLTTAIIRKMKREKPPF